MSTKRKMASLRKISGLYPIEGADKIEIAHVDGWQVVVQKGEYEAGDEVIYLEVDSWVPLELAPFLQRNDKVKTYNGVEGNRLKTIKLRGRLSQGLVLAKKDTFSATADLTNEDDLDTLLGIQKWEPALSPSLAGVARGSFPAFLQKTDQERIQNCFKYLDDEDRNLAWEVTEKLDGSSMTAYFKDGKFGVCSRNIDLKEDATNTFWKVARENLLEEKLHKIYNELADEVAFQGELCGPGIQGNKYGLTKHMFFVFDIYSITAGQYLWPQNARHVCNEMGLLYVPYLGTGDLPLYMDTFLAAADGTSFLNPSVLREGLVFKRSEHGKTCKVISNEWLLTYD